MADDVLISQLMDIVLTAASLLGAEGGAYGMRNQAGDRLQVTDVYPSQIFGRAPIRNSFSLPIQGTSGSGWKSVVHHEEAWSSEIDDARYTEEFKSYHQQAGRRYFLHFPVIFDKSPEGFLGLAFRNPSLMQGVHLKSVQLLASYAGMLTASHTGYTLPPPASLACVVTERGEPSFTQKLQDHVDLMIVDGRWEALKTKPLAAAMGYSVRQFHELFIRSLGITPHEWVLRRRLSFGLKMLLENHPVSYVAFRLGFSDQAHFAKRFRERYGYLPSEARLKN